MQTQHIVLVTYKGKILLTSVDSPFENCVWGFIENKDKLPEFLSNNAIKTIKRETQLTELSMDRISLSHSDTDYIFHIRLTDSNVNAIVRRSGQRIEFYGLEEVGKLKLSEVTNYILTKFGTEIAKLVRE